MKVLLIGGTAAAVLVLTVLAVAHAKRACKYATIFLDHY